MNSDERRYLGSQLTFIKHDIFFRAGQRPIPGNLKVAPLGRQLCFRDPFDRETARRIRADILFNDDLIGSTTHRRPSDLAPLAQYCDLFLSLRNYRSTARAATSWVADWNLWVKLLPMNKSAG